MSATSVPFPSLDERRLPLLNTWQHGFPLVERPYFQIAQRLGWSEDEVLSAYCALQRTGAISRIGGVFSPRAGGAALLAAMAVPPDRLRSVAATVSAHPGVNHNYEREHALNLWFVMTGNHCEAVETAVRSLEQLTGQSALRLRMQRAYRIDLGFDLRHRTAVQPMRKERAGDAAPLGRADFPLAQCVEEGLGISATPFDDWAQRSGRSCTEVLETLQTWLDTGILKRFGVVVRHHELGFSANAMTVFDVPDALVDPCGEALARQPGVTLAYRRARATNWPYNLYCMVHGMDRSVVQAVLDRVVPAAGLSTFPREVLFSIRRFKQTGGRRFREPTPRLSTAATPEQDHAVA